MSAEVAYRLVSLAALPWWGVWLVAPRSAWAARAASHSGVFIALGALYALWLAQALAAGGAADLSFDGVRQALASRLGFLAGWTHYVALDLFAGAWMVREARRLRVEPRPYLLAALLFAPLGLAAFLVRRAVRLRSFTQLGETDLV